MSGLHLPNCIVLTHGFWPSFSDDRFNTVGWSHEGLCDLVSCPRCGHSELGIWSKPYDEDLPSLRDWALVCASCQWISSVSDIDQRERTALYEWADNLEEAEARSLTDDGGALPGVGEPRALGFPEVDEWAQSSLDILLDSEQAAAVAADGRNALVVARAGSGKTRVLTTKALWLQQVRGVDPSQLLLLAFNVKAAEEMRKRLEPHVGAEMPHVLTFHALAYAVVQPFERMIVDDRVSGQRELMREVTALGARGGRPSVPLRSVIKRLTENESLLGRVVRFMLAPFLNYWTRIAEGTLDLAVEDADALREHREAQLEQPNVFVAGDKHALNGDPVKSYGELAISDALFLNDVRADYERVFDWDGTPYRPDFTISTGDDTGVVIEYFGLLGDRDYREQARRKRRYWKRKSGWTLVEFKPFDVATRGEDDFKSYLLEALRGLGVESRPLSPEEIKERLAEEVTVNDYTRPLISFISRCRNLGWSHEDLRMSIRRHRSDDAEERAFLNLAEGTYGAYLEEVIGNDREDFNGLLWRAAAKIEQGETRFTYQSQQREGDLQQVRHILIDEFQDFSKPFHAVISAVQGVNPDVNVFAVGDDWQAINGFAGSDPKFFEEFDRYFDDPEQLHLSRNYRSARSIVEVSNALMSRPGSGEPEGVAVTSRAGQARLWDLDELEPLPDTVTTGVLRLLAEHFDNDREVVLLSRTNEFPRATDIDEYLRHIRSLLPERQHERVSISTTHKFKGLEATAVIVLDARTRRYPLKHPDWKYQRLFGDTEQALAKAEKRLFYVALTRAEQSLDIITAGAEERSPFLARISRHLAIGDWQTLPPVEPVGPENVEIRVDGYAVRDYLGQVGYEFHSRTRTWRKTVPRSSFRSFEDIRSEPWFVPPVAVEIVSTSGVVWSGRA